MISFPNNQVKFIPRLAPEKQRALASFHIMNSVKVGMVAMMIITEMIRMVMMMIVTTVQSTMIYLSIIAAACLFVSLEQKSYGFQVEQ